MKVVGLLSGGKDSCFNLCHCARQGHEIVALATLAPPEGKDELDSYMYQTVGHDAVHLVAQAMGLPLYRQVITGKPLQTGAQFGIDEGGGDETAAAGAADSDETEDLHRLLLSVKADFPDVQGVSVGAILSNYQRFRVETICARPSLALTPLAFLWQRPQADLLAEMVAAGLEAVLIKVAGIGLKERHLGRSLAQMQPELTRLNAMYGAHVCGEGGEYETLTLDCPLFKKRIQLDRTEVVVHDESDIAPVAYLRIHAASLQDKEQDQPSLQEVVAVPPLLDRLARRTYAASLRSQRASSSSESTSSRPPLHLITPRTTGPRRSEAQLRIRRKDNWLSIHGAVPTGPSDGADCGSEDAQVYQAFEQLQTALASHGLSLPHIQHIDLATRSQATFAATNAIYKRHFGVEPPSRACVALPHLRQGHALEMDAVAYDDGSRYGTPSAGGTALPRQTHPGDRPHKRQALHVQSLSYWASANIGPYSQAVSAASRVSISGQIGLRPVDLTLPQGEDSKATQIAVSLQHARRIFDALLEERGRKGKGWIEGGVCWLAGPRYDAGSNADAKANGLLLAAAAGWSAQGRAPPELAAASDDDEDDEEDGEEQDSDPKGWLFGTQGVLSSSLSSSSPHAPAPAQTKTQDAHALPLLYATVAHDGLPRGACVEWQVTGHDGRRVRARRRSADGAAGEAEDEDDEEDSEEAPRPVVATRTFRLPLSALCPDLAEGSHPHTVTVHTRSVESFEGASAMGVVCLRVEAHGEGNTSAAPAGPAPHAGLEEVKARLRGALSVKAFVALGSASASSSSAEVGEEHGRMALGRTLLDSLLSNSHLKQSATPAQPDTEGDAPAHSTAGVYSLNTVSAAGGTLQVGEWGVGLVWRDA